MPRSRRVDPDDVDRDEEETTTRRRRRTAAEETEEDERPRRRRRDEEDDDEETPRRRRSKADDDDEEERPARRRRRDEDEETGDEEDDESAVIPVHRGRKAIKDNRPTSERGDAFFKWDDDGEPQVVKFLDTEPWSYNQHWVKRDGKQSFPCMGTNCPLCDIGVKVNQKVVYTLVNLSHKGGPKVQTLEVTITLDETLMGYDEDKKTGPLDRLFWALSRNKRSKSSGGRAKYNYVFTPIKERDLEEDWEIVYADVEDAVLDAEVPSTQDVLGDWTRKGLQKIADEVMGLDD